MSKPIKFDLPIDGQKVANRGDLRGHFTTEILDHFRNGVLAKWLRSRPELSAELKAVEELPADGDDVPTLLALCQAFGVDADEHTVEAALAVATGTPASPSASFASRQLRDGQISANLAPGREDKWFVDVPAPALVQVDIHAAVDIACALENLRGRQFATDGTVERRPFTSLAVILSRGTYCIRIRAVDQGAFAKYDLRLRQGHQARTSDLPGDNVLRSEESILTIKDLKIDAQKTSSGSYQTIWEQRATLAADCADLWVVDIPEKRASIRTKGNVDTVGRLLGPDGSVLAKDDNSGAGLNFAIATPAPLAGEFAVLVSGSNSRDKGDYLFRVTLKPGGRPRQGSGLLDVLHTLEALTAFGGGFDQPPDDGPVQVLRSRGLRIVWDELRRPRNWHS